VHKILQFHGNMYCENILSYAIMDPRSQIKGDRTTHRLRLTRAALAELHGMLDAAVLEQDVALGRVRLEVPEWLARMYPKAKELACP